MKQGVKRLGPAQPDRAAVDLVDHAVARAGAKRLVLTHFYPECDGVDIETQCRKTWQGPLTLAEDLMVIKLPDG